MLPLQYELPAKEGVEACTITNEFIKGESEVELRFEEKKEAN